MDLQHIVMFAVLASVRLTMFGFGLDATKQDLLYVATRPWLLIRSLLGMFVIMPTVAVALARSFSFRPEVEIVLVALAISPVPPLLPRKEGKAGGRASFALGLMATAAVLSIVIVPVALEILARYFAQPLAIAPGRVAAIVLKSVLVPLLLGMLFRLWWPAVAERLASPVVSGAGILLLAGVLALVAGSVSAIRTEIGGGTVAAMAVFVVVGLTVGHLLGGPDPQARIVLALSTACRHPGIALAIVAANFPEAQVVMTVLLFLIVSSAVCVPYVVWQRRATAEATAPA